MLRISFLSAFFLALFMAAPAFADSFWNHNGSEMRLVVDGASYTFLYERPRSGIAAQGVRRGTVLFQGRLSEEIADENGELSRKLAGTAFIFSARCGDRPYKVSGDIMSDGLDIRLAGKAPRIDRSNCQQTGVKDDTLEFKLVRDDAIPPFPQLSEGSICGFADLATSDVSGEEYQACIEREANRVCQGRVAAKDLVRCFRFAVVWAIKTSGLTGNALVVADTPFTACGGGVCRLYGGGPSYSCVRLDSRRVRECDGDVESEHCNEVDCPVRKCRMLCGKAEE